MEADVFVLYTVLNFYAQYKKKPHVLLYTIIRRAEFNCTINNTKSPTQFRLTL